jgi:hypothetical protein
LGIAVGAPPVDGTYVATEVSVVGDGVSPPVKGAVVTVAEDPNAPEGILGSIPEVNDGYTFLVPVLCTFVLLSYELALSRAQNREPKSKIWIPSLLFISHVIVDINKIASVVPHYCVQFGIYYLLNY